MFMANIMTYHWPQTKKDGKEIMQSPIGGPFYSTDKVELYKDINVMSLTA